LPPIGLRSKPRAKAETLAQARAEGTKMKQLGFSKASILTINLIRTNKHYPLLLQSRAKVGLIKCYTNLTITVKIIYLI